MTNTVLFLQSRRFFPILNFLNIGISYRGGRGRGRRNFQRVPQKQHRTNEEIRVKEVRLVDEQGEPLGVVALEQALSMAREKEVDLVEISPKADPPVCKLIDYGKMLYAIKKREQQAKKATQAQEMKGVRLTFRMDVGDADRQRKNAEDFLKKGHPVRIALTMRGREKAHKDLAFGKLNAFVKSLEEISTLENNPRAAGHQIVAVLKPSKSQK